MIDYAETLDGITPDRLRGFFGDWPAPPTPEAHLRILAGSDRVVLAVDAGTGAGTGAVVGYVTALTDGVSCAYIPHLEVVPTHRGRGIGTELVRRLLARLDRLYMVDLVCDPALVPFYERLGLRPATAMSLRRYEYQAAPDGA
jgi:GNAT superfamily N-acetyltransferase